MAFGSKAAGSELQQKCYGTSIDITGQSFGVVPPGDSPKGHGESKTVSLLHSSKSRASLISNLEGNICPPRAPLNRSYVGTRPGWHHPNH